MAVGASSLEYVLALASVQMLVLGTAVEAEPVLVWGAAYCLPMAKATLLAEVVLELE